MQINNELKSKNNFMCWFPWLLWTNKPIFFPANSLKKPRHSNDLRLYVYVSLTSHVISQVMQQPRLWIKRKLQCKLFLVNHYPLSHLIPIFGWDICNYQQQTIPLEWLHSFSSVKTQKIMMSHCSPAQRRYHRDPTRYSSCSLWEKKSSGLERRHGLQHIHLRNHFPSCVKLPALDQRLCWSSLSTKEWLSQ